MEDFTRAEFDRYRFDRDRLHKLWEKFRTLHTDGVTSEPHWPPATNDLALTILDVIGANETTLDHDTLDTLINYGAAMFNFGQFVRVHNVYAEHLQQCVCGRISDKEIEQLMKQDRQ